MSTTTRRKARKHPGVVKPTYRKGSRVTMLFHMYGLVSEEEYTVLKATKDGRTITIDSDEDETKCFRFDTRTGVCLNDNTWGGARRELKIARVAGPVAPPSLEAANEPSEDDYL